MAAGFNKRKRRRRQTRPNHLWVTVEGDRAYAMGNSIARRKQLKAMGCRWDVEKGRWWIPFRQRFKLIAMCNKLRGIKNADAAVQMPPNLLPCYGTVIVAGKPFYAIGETADKLRITNLDTTLDCEVSKSKAQWVDRFHPVKIANALKHNGTPFYISEYFTLEEIRSYYLPHQFPLLRVRHPRWGSLTRGIVDAKRRQQ